MDFLHFYPSLSTTAIGTPVKPSGEFGPVEVQTEGCVSWKQGRLSPGSVARSIKKITPELLTITEPEVNFRKRRFRRLVRVSWAMIWVGSIGD